MRSLELLAPARDADTAVAAILHGADAVYIGPSAFGARKAASNSLDEIARVVDFAHIFGARVYATVNTIVHDRELQETERLITDLYRRGVDAIIVQDMGILRLDIPPIALHASTQCDTTTVVKAMFLEEVGFSQIVLARELSISEIAEVCRNVSVPVECFIHGALCVSYSGRCHISQACRGRSANRGECAQMCRQCYTLRDADGRVLERDKYLLSLRDFNASASLGDMIAAGVSSFKIEGRLKDAAYVKNVTAHYRRLLDGFIAENPEELKRSSFGTSSIDFTPDVYKSFNRGFTDYFLMERRPRNIASLLTPKSLGEPVKDIHQLNNGDGISYFTPDGKYMGLHVNRVEGNRILTRDNARIPAGVELRRTRDNRFEQALARPTAERRIAIDVKIDRSGVTARDERGAQVRLPLDITIEKAKRPMDLRPHFAKLGNTPYVLRGFENGLDADVFVPASQLAALRRRLVETLGRNWRAIYPYDYRRAENPEAKFPDKALTYKANVSNHLAEAFYRDHGVESIEPAAEVKPLASGSVVMTCRHCILRETGRCLKEGTKLKQPLTITTGNDTFRLRFDCDRCEMQVLI